jgi:putative aminopeptidase FrvX
MAKTNEIQDVLNRGTAFVESKRKAQRNQKDNDLIPYSKDELRPADNARLARQAAKRSLAAPEKQALIADIMDYANLRRPTGSEREAFAALTEKAKAFGPEVQVTEADHYWMASRELDPSRDTVVLLAHLDTEGKAGVADTKAIKDFMDGNCDDSLGMALAMKEFKEALGLPLNVVVLFTCGEETAHTGAIAAAEKIIELGAMVVNVDTCDVEHVGSDDAVVLYDYNKEKPYNFDSLRRKALQIAGQTGVKAITAEGKTNDFEAFITGKYDIPGLAMEVPITGMHSNHERARLIAIENASLMLHNLLGYLAYNVDFGDKAKVSAPKLRMPAMPHEGTLGPNMMPSAPTPPLVMDDGGTKIKDRRIDDTMAFSRSKNERNYLAFMPQDKQKKQEIGSGTGFFKPFKGWRDDAAWSTVSSNWLELKRMQEAIEAPPTPVW